MSGGDAPSAHAISRGFNNSLHESIHSGNAERAMSIIEHALCPPLNDRDSKGNTALHLAVRKRMYKVVKVLLNLGALVSPLDEDRY